MHRLFEWLGSTPWSVDILESFWVWPLLESTHVLTTGLFVGTAVMMDFRSGPLHRTHQLESSSGY